MKNINIIASIMFLTAVAILLSGCGKKTTTTTSSTADDYFPGVDRTTTVNPSGEITPGTGSSVSSSGQDIVSTNLKIGSVTQIKAYKYNLEGLVKITGQSTFLLDAFSYDGTCPGFKLYLTKSNSPSTIVTQFNLPNRQYSNASSTLNMQNATINDVDSVAMTCSNSEDPIFVTNLQ